MRQETARARGGDGAGDPPDVPAASRPGADKRGSLRALARRLAVDPKSVRRAVKSGRLTRSIGYAVDSGGKRFPIVQDMDLAVREWVENASQPGAEDKDSLAEAQRRVHVQRELALRLANKVRRGQLLRADHVKRDQYACARAARDAVLNVPDRVAAELAAEMDPGRVHSRLIAELRLALVDVVERIERGE